MEWKHYDFVTNWAKVREVWLSERVQDVLEPIMVKWCREQAYFNSDGTKPTWKRGSDLWTYSKTDFHAQRIMDAVNDYNAQHRDKKRKEEEEDDDEDEDYDDDADWEEYERLSKMFEPEKGSQLASIMMMGSDFLSVAFGEVASILFPEEDDQVVVTFSRNHGGIAVILKHRLIFDWCREFHYREGSTSLSPSQVAKDWHLDKVVEGKYALKKGRDIYVDYQPFFDEDGNQYEVDDEGDDLLGQDHEGQEDEDDEEDDD